MNEEQKQIIMQWVMDQAATKGRSLTQHEYDLARAVNVRHPENINLVEVDEMPGVPAEVRDLSYQYLNPRFANGLTLGQTVFIIKDQISDRLLRHEFRHVYQVERMGLPQFMDQYLREILEDGYENSSLEIDARAHEE